MKVYQLVEHGKPLEVRQVDKPVPTGHEVLARTIVTGVCHTDVHVTNGDCGCLKLPLTPGHEGVGVIEAVGEEVKTMKIGDRIGVAWLNRSCMACYLCDKGRENLCESQIQTGFKIDGSFAEYFIADERFAARIPDEISDVQAAPILCAGVTSYRALHLAEVRKGDRVVVSGACGGLGHLAIQYAKAIGCEVVALDVFDADKKALVESLNVDYIVDLLPGEDEMKLAEKFKALQPEKPIAASLIFAPALRAVSDAVEYVAPGGTIVCVALPPGSYQVNVAKFVFKELRLHGSIVGSPEDLREAFRYAAEGSIKAHVIEKPFSCINDVLRDLKEGKTRGGRVCIRVLESN